MHALGSPTVVHGCEYSRPARDTMSTGERACVRLHISRWRADMGDARDDVHVSSACECMPGSAQSVKMECDLRAMPRDVLSPVRVRVPSLAHVIGGTRGRRTVACGKRLWQGAGSRGRTHACAVPVRLLVAPDSRVGSGSGCVACGVCGLRVRRACSCRYTFDGLIYRVPYSVIDGFLSFRPRRETAPGKGQGPTRDGGG